jgi:hypothetical protein
MIHVFTRNRQMPDIGQPAANSQDFRRLAVIVFISPPLGYRWPASHRSGDKRNHKQHQENEKEEACDLRHGDGDATKAENAGDDRDDEEYDGPAQHLRLLLY